MNKLLIVIAVIINLAIPVTAEENLKIATSIFPIYDITKNIAGDKADVIYIVPIGANPHTFVPTPSTIKQIKEVDFFIGINSEFDGWIEKFLHEETAVHYLGGHHEIEHEDDHHHENPHIWLTVKGGMEISEKIAQIFINADSQNEKIYRKNLEGYRKKLSELDEEIVSMFANLENKKFIQWHPAWDYFAEDYNLEVVATIQKGHGDEPSVKEFMNITQKAKKAAVTVIVIGLNVQSKSVEALRKEIDGKIVRLDSIGDPKKEETSTYVKLMRYNARVLSEGLR